MKKSQILVTKKNKVKIINLVGIWHMLVEVLGTLNPLQHVWCHEEALTRHRSQCGTVALVGILQECAVYTQHQRERRSSLCIIQNPPVRYTNARGLRHKWRLFVESWGETWLGLGPANPAATIALCSPARDQTLELLAVRWQCKARHHSVAQEKKTKKQSKNNKPHTTNAAWPLSNNTNRVNGHCSHKSSTPLKCIDITVYIHEYHPHRAIWQADMAAICLDSKSHPRGQRGLTGVTPLWPHPSSQPESLDINCALCQLGNWIQIGSLCSGRYVRNYTMKGNLVPRALLQWAPYFFFWFTHRPETAPRRWWTSARPISWSWKGRRDSSCVT